MGWIAHRPAPSPPRSSCKRWPSDPPRGLRISAILLGLGPVQLLAPCMLWRHVGSRPQRNPLGVRCGSARTAGSLHRPAGVPPVVAWSILSVTVRDRPADSAGETPVPRSNFANPKSRILASPRTMRRRMRSARYSPNGEPKPSMNNGRWDYAARNRNTTRQWGGLPICAAGDLPSSCGRCRGDPHLSVQTLSTFVASSTAAKRN